MKRAITALTLVCALMLSVVACQVYNPTNNETIYTAMRTEGAISWADYSKKFEEADKDGKYDILKEYETFRKLHKDQKTWEDAIKAYDDALAAYEAANKVLADATIAYSGKKNDKGDLEIEGALQVYEADKTEANELAMYRAEKAVAKAETALVNAEKAMKDARKAVLYTVEDLKALWDKEYDVLWDWNGKM